MRRSNIIGVDVSDSSIKVLQLDDANNIIAYGTDTLQVGVVENGHIINKEAFKETLTTILKNTKPKVLYSENVILRAVLCLPETRLFTHYLSVPDTVRKSEIAAHVEADAKKIVPYELEDLYWDFHVAEKEGKRFATFVGVPKPDLENYVEAFSFADVKPSFVGGELFSLGRALLPSGTLEESHLIVDIGAHTTTVGIFGNDVIANVSIIVPKGGDFFTKVISDELEISTEEAEEHKRQYGVDPSHKKTKVREILYPHIMLIIDKINEAKAYFEKKTGKQITRIIVAGGSALLPGLRDLIAEKTGITPTLADPIVAIPNKEVLGEDVSPILFSTVVGLALHAVADVPSINLLTLYRYQENETQKELLKIEDIRTLSDFYYFMYGVFHVIKEVLAAHAQYLAFIRKINVQLVASFVFLGVTLAFLAWVVLKYM